MKKNILSLAALLIASATFVACSSDDNIIDEQPAKAQTYTMTINASKGSNATTRALVLDGKTLNASWATSENVYVQKGSDWATGSLQPQADGTTATLKGTLSGITIAENDVLTLQFPRSGALDYTGQVGTLADIAAKYDYATASVTVASISASGNIIPEAATTTFTNQQAIVKFTLKDKGNSDAAISASELTVSDGTNSYTVTPASATDEIYVAIPGFSSQTVTLTAIVGEDTYTYEKANVTFTNGQYYEITVKMEKEAAPWDGGLSTLTTDATANDGTVITGTLSANVKISIADGATVTLDGATINGSGNSNKWAGITCLGDATIILSGTNTVKGFNVNYPGIYVPEGKTVTIKGDGQLTASSNGYGAGIGGGYNIACGNIRIEGGTITATGGFGAAGIGGGLENSCGTITITDDVTSVTATAGMEAKSIGAGLDGTCGTVTIGGTVYPDGISDSPYTYQPKAVAGPTAYTLAKSEVGMIVGTDGNAYAVADKDNLPSSAIAVGMVAYKNGSNGLVIALTDEGSMQWSYAKEECEFKARVGGHSWYLPSVDEWKQMLKANGGSESSFSGLKDAVTAAGGSLDEQYWTSTESGSTNAYYVANDSFDSSVIIDTDYKGEEEYCARAVFAF